MPITKRKRTATTANGSVFEFVGPFIDRCRELRDTFPVQYEDYIRDSHVQEIGSYARSDIPLDLIERRVGYRLQQKGYEKQGVKIPERVQAIQNQIESEIEIMMAKPGGKRRPAKGKTQAARKPRAGVTQYVFGILRENNTKHKTDNQISAMIRQKFPEHVAAYRISHIKDLRRKLNRGVGAERPKESILEWGSDGLPIEDTKKTSAKWAKEKSVAPLPKVKKWGGVKEEKEAPAPKSKKKVTKVKK